MQLERNLATQHSIEQVFDYMAHFHRVIEWDASVVHTEKRTPGAISIGTEFVIDVRFMGRVSRLIYTVISMQAPNYIELRGQADVYTVIDRITLARDADGGTQMHYALSVQYSPSMETLANWLTPLINRNVDSAIAGLKRALTDAPEGVQRYPAWLDRCVLPGALQFTRYGYFWAKKKWKGLNVDLTGKNILVTGATSGLGRATALALADLGASVIAVARDQEKGGALAEEVRSHTGKAIRLEYADLSSLRATLLLGQKLVDEGIPLHGLVNNAGALFNERQVTSESYEKSFALLLLSPFMLTETVLPLLEASGEGRVINVASGGMYTQAVHLDDLNFEKESYDGPKAYARAKRGLVDMTRLWAEKYGTKKVHFHAMHPGWADTQAVADSLPGFHKVMSPFLRTPEQGADTIVWLTAAREALLCNGEFWLDRRVHTTSVFPGTESSQKTRETLYLALSEIRVGFSEGNVRVKKKEATAVFISNDTVPSNAGTEGERFQNTP